MWCTWYLIKIPSFFVFKNVYLLKNYEAVTIIIIIIEWNKYINWHLRLIRFYKDFRLCKIINLKETKKKKSIKCVTLVNALNYSFWITLDRFLIKISISKDFSRITLNDDNWMKWGKQRKLEADAIDIFFFYGKSF
jgi:hypothetical protein